MARPISTELAHIYVTGDSKKFLYLEDAKKHQETLERNELNKDSEPKDEDSLLTKIRSRIVKWDSGRTK